MTQTLKTSLVRTNGVSTEVIRGKKKKRKKMWSKIDFPIVEWSAIIN